MKNKFRFLKHEALNSRKQRLFGIWNSESVLGIS
jgi:hypothetical protein